jgi:hypothetical protein
MEKSLQHWRSPLFGVDHVSARRVLVSLGVCVNQLLNLQDNEWDCWGKTRLEMTIIPLANNEKTSAADQAQHDYGISQSLSVFAFTST